MPALAAADIVSTDLINTGALPLMENPNPPVPRDTCTNLITTICVQMQT